MPGAEAVVARARLALGTRFRAQGRTLADGLDCIGLAAFALEIPDDKVRRDYRLRGGDLAALEAELSDLGLARVDEGAPHAGGLALFVPGPGQIHMGILTGTGLIHADALLRSVVERPGPPPWPLRGLWRLRDERRD